MNAVWCELHLHIEGTLEPAMIFERARVNHLALDDPNEGALAARYQFTDLQSFLNLYYDNMRVLQTEEDFFAMATAYLRRAHAGGVRHAELFVDPQAHSNRGVPANVVLGGLQRALVDAEVNLGMSGGIIPCILRDESLASAHGMLDDVLATGVPLLGIGLDSAEVGHPPVLFKSVFEAARAAGLHAVAHAGEEGDPSYIWQAIDEIGVERIDHGIRAIEDDALVARLVADQIPLTVCPLSNVRLRAVRSINEHPLPHLLERGVKVTVNSDDPAYFGGYLDDNIAALRSAFALDDHHILTLALNSVDASFAPDETKDLLRTQIS